MKEIKVGQRLVICQSVDEVVAKSGAYVKEFVICAKVGENTCGVISLNGFWKISGREVEVVEVHSNDDGYDTYIVKLVCTDEEKKDFFDNNRVIQLTKEFFVDFDDPSVNLEGVVESVRFV